MIDWPANLVNDFARRRAILIIGSGVSRHSAGTGGSHPPTWKAFLERAIIDCPDQENINIVKEAVSSNDLLHACEWLKKRFDETWIDYLRKIFLYPAFTPAEIHKKILGLDCRIVFSLNFDDIYERFSNGIHHGSHIVKNYNDPDIAEFLRGSGRYIVKVHGNLSTPNNLIFSQKDYSRARVSNSSFYQAFDAALLTHTFVFVGSGFADPDINLLLENQNFGFATQTPHYFICPSGMSSERRGSLRDNRNLKVLEYDPVDTHHSGLVMELDSLNDRVQEEIERVWQSLDW